MSNHAKKLLKAALALPRAELADLVDELCVAIAEAPDPELHADWNGEIKRRLDEIDSGAVKLIPWKTVHKELRAIVRKSASRKPASRSKKRGG